MKKIFILLIIFSFVSFGASAIVTSSNQEGPVDGTFETINYNNPVEIDAFTFEYDGSADPSNLNPQDTYYFKLDVTEYDSIDDLERVQIIFYDQDVVTFSDDLETSNTGDVVVFEWQKDDELSIGGEMGINYSSSLNKSPSGITWEITSSTAPALTVDPNNKTGAAFEVEFKISKVANESSNWTFGFNIDDGVLNPDAASKNVSNASIQTGNDPEGGQTTYTMGWYGEISVPSGTIQWTSIEPNTNFDSANSDVLVDGFTFISNGDYAEAVAVSKTWAAITSQLGNVTGVALTSSTDITNNDPEQTFALKIESIEMVTNTDTNKSYSDQLIINSSQSRTDEDGVSQSYTIYIMTPAIIQNATYSGDIKFVITND